MDRYLACIYAAAVGDAMGAATETRSAEMIYRDFGGWVEDILPPPDDCFAYGCRAGTVTDDFSLAYYLAVAIAANDGEVDESDQWRCNEDFSGRAATSERCGCDDS